MQAIFQRWFGDIQFSLRTAFLFSVALSPVLAAVAWVEPTYRHHLLFTLGFASLLLFRIGVWGVLSFFLGAAAGAMWGIHEINWLPTDPPFDDCLIPMPHRGRSSFWRSTDCSADILSWPHLESERPINHRSG